MSSIVKAINVGEYVLLRHEGQCTMLHIENSIKSVDALFGDIQWNKLLVDLRNVIDRVRLIDVYYAIEAGKMAFPFAKIGILFSPGCYESNRCGDTVAFNRSLKLKSSMAHEVS